MTAYFKDSFPEAPVICTDRLPLHRRAYAEWISEIKKRLHIPILFCGGKPEKVQPARLKFPGAVFCSNEGLRKTLEKMK
jgi:hypothetical protein